MPEPTELLTVTEVADLLRVRPSTVYSWSETGVLPTFRVGRLLRFKRSQIEAWLTSRSNRRFDDMGSEPRAVR